MKPQPQSPYCLATSSEVASIVALVESAYRGDSSRAGWTTEADLLDGQRIDAVGVDEVIRRADSLVLLHPDAEGLLACAHLERRGKDAYFGMFAVRPQAQGQGTGRKLVAEAERLAQALWQTRRMTMSVIMQREDLIAWYRRLGYRSTHQYAPFPYGDERFGQPRRPDLRFEILVKPLSETGEMPV